MAREQQGEYRAVKSDRDVMRSAARAACVRREREKRQGFCKK